MIMWEKIYPILMVLTSNNESLLLLKELRIITQKAQARKWKKATPVREGVVLIKPQHQAEDLIRLGQKLQERFGIKLIQAYTHKDEGR